MSRKRPDDSHASPVRPPSPGRAARRPSRAVAILALSSLLALFLLTPGAAQTPTPEATETPTATQTPATGATATPTAEASPESAEPAEPGRTTDTEYVKVHIDPTGKPLAAWLKDWIRLRGAGKRSVVDPGVFATTHPLHGSPGPDVQEASLKWNLSVPDVGFQDLYYEGRLQQAGDLFVTPEGPRPLPVSVRIRYFTGDEGSEQEVEPTKLETSDVPQRFKIVVTLTNTTKRQEEVAYTDIQTKRTIVGTGPVYTPYVARVVDLVLPDGQFDQIRTDGQLTRTGTDTVINWTKNLVPPDFPAKQDAIVTGVIAAGALLPEIKIVAQPLFPPFEAEALSAEGTQFERGRRSFFYDVFNLFRENLIALTGLFGLLHDAFGNLSIPVLGPEKGNREAGSFDKPNQLWALWTLAKGIEQLDRAMNVITNAVELSRDAVKGQLATLQQLRLLLGFSSDEASQYESILDCLADPPSCGAALQEGLTNNSIWADYKQILGFCAPANAFAAAGATDPYLPDAPLVETALCPTAAVSLNVVALKMAILEHVMHALQKENHLLDTANLAGLAPLPAAAAGGDPCGGDDQDNCSGQVPDSYNKYVFIKFPFGLEELERGLHTLKTKGFDPLQAAIGNIDTPNSVVWALHVLTQGAEAQVDAFHQLGATWRFIADSIQNFGIFGVETSRNILQWDIEGIDIDSAIKAAEVARAREMATFMGRPTDKDGEPAIGQLVVTFSTTALNEQPMATDTTGGKAGVVFASTGILITLLGWARFRWFLI